MRQFQICENKYGLATWSVDEIIEGYRWWVADVKSWRVVCGTVAANPLGFIRIEAAALAVRNDYAQFG